MRKLIRRHLCHDTSALFRTRESSRQWSIERQQIHKATISEYIFAQLTLSSPFLQILLLCHLCPSFPSKARPSLQDECEQPLPLTPRSTPIPIANSLPDRRMGLRKAHDPGREITKTPKSSRKDPERARPGASQAREPREEADPGYQEERQERANGRL